MADRPLPALDPDLLERGHRRLRELQRGDHCVVAFVRNDRTGWILEQTLSLKEANRIIRIPEAD